MQIKNLTPKSKEILFQPKAQQGILYDVFSYAIQNPAKNGNGNGNGPTSLAANGIKYLYIVSQIHSSDQLDYVPNLIATFIKRELESNGPTSLAANDSSEKNDSFETSLKKTNELIEGLLKNNGEIKINLGIALLNKDKISASKIGKAKLYVYRPEKQEIFDIFENVSQFSKFQIDNKRFSNIISGEVKKNDRFFFYVPDQRLNLKQKLITASFSKNGQKEFIDDFHKIVSPEGKQNKVPISCCGIHFEIDEEITNLSDAAASKPPKIVEETPIVATEVAKINKNDTLKRAVGKFKEMVIGENSKSDNRWRLIKQRGTSNYFIFGFIAFLVLAGLIFFIKGDSKLKEEISSINEKIRVSESRLLMKQNYEARQYLSEAINRLNALEESRQKNETLITATSLFNRIEKIDSMAKPSLLIDFTSFANADYGKYKNVLASNGTVFINGFEKIFQMSGNELKPVEESGGIISAWIKENKLITYGANIRITDLKNKNTNDLKKKFNFEPVEFKNYEDNLYFLGSKNIYKITNALMKPTQEFDWLKSTEAEKVPGSFVSFDLDSTIYIITNERKMAFLFKGELNKLIDLDFDIKPSSKLFSLDNPSTSLGTNKRFLIIDKETKLARVIDDTGELKVSYDLSGAETVKDAYFDKIDSTLYILSPAKVWNLKI